MEREDIIKKISIARTNANLSARALSQKIEMNDGYINRLESKKDFLPSVEVLLKIIEACNMTVEQFFYNDFISYEKDMKIISLLNRVSDKEKDAIITLLERKWGQGLIVLVNHCLVWNFNIFIRLTKNKFYG